MLKGSFTQKLIEALETHPNSQTHSGVSQGERKSTHANTLEVFAGHVWKHKKQQKIKIACPYAAHVVSSMRLEASSVQLI